MLKSIMRMSSPALAISLLLVCSSAVRAQQVWNTDDGGMSHAPQSIAPNRFKINDSTVRLYGVLDARPTGVSLIGDSQLFKILNDGTFVPIGVVLPDNDLEAMDISPVTGKMFAVTRSGPFAGNLYEVNKSSGALTLIANTGLPDIISGSFHPITGEFWVYRHLFGLYTINLDTAVPTFRHTPNGTGVFKTWEGMAWDNTGTFLYGQNRDRLYRWNPGDADGTNDTEILCLGLQAGEGLDFSPGGTLFGGLDANDPAALRIFTLNAATCAQIPSGINMPAGDVEGIAFETVPPPCTGHIGDFVWNDLNANGIQDAGEPGIPGVRVNLTGPGGPFAPATTDALGLYGFSGLCIGDYVVTIDATTIPPAFVASPCNVPPDDTKDNDCSPKPVNLPTDLFTDVTNDFGYHCQCTDTDPCTLDRCDPVLGCVHGPNCSDGNACTMDSCTGTAPKGCVNTPRNCDDGNVCTTDRCDPTTGQCVHDPLECDDDNACTTDLCTPTSGCSHNAIDCTDHNKCTNDSCDPESGCVRVAVDCSDGNACTDDSCVPTSGCVRTTHDCNDHNKCTNDSCDRDNGCVNTTINCEDGNACTNNMCDPLSGCFSRTIDCNDGNACTNDSCNPASGCVRTTVNCDDSNLCTSDACDPASGCSHQNTNCNDNNPCTNDFCNALKGCLHAPVVCNDNDQCTTDTCTLVKGCVFTPRNCSDGNPCTSDSCNPSTGCVNSPPANCNDGNACTADSCNPTSGACVNPPISCEDNDPCTIDTCNPSTGCRNTPKNCDDGVSCTIDACDPTTGTCTHSGGSGPSCSVMGEPDLCGGETATYTTDAVGSTLTYKWTITAGPCTIVGPDTGPSVQVRGNAIGNCTVSVKVTDSASGCEGTCSQGVCVHGQSSGCNPIGQCLVPYPYTSGNPRTSIDFNESEVLRAFTISTVNGCFPAQIRVWYSDERALTLGVRRVIIKTSGGTKTTDYPITPLLTNPGSATDPQVGSTVEAGDQAGTDLSGRPMFPALFITDVTNNPSNMACDWQSGPNFPPECAGHTAIPPHAIFGTWKGAVRTIDKTRNPVKVTVQPDPDPAQNHWDIGSGDPVPPGITNQGFGTEVRWDVNRLGLIEGHTYRVYFMVHDGDQNKTGGDVGHDCSNLLTQTQPTCTETAPLCNLGYPFPSANPRTNVIFNESEVLRAFSPNVAGPGDTIKVWYNDEKALTLGVRRVSIKTSSGTQSTDYPVTPLGSVPGSATNPQVGTTALTGDQAGTDQSARPMWPALFITDITSNPDSRACDWQSGPSFPAECAGHTAIPPNAVFGTWKGAVRLVDKTHNPTVVSVTPDADPAHNDWNLGAGDPAPAGATNQGFGAEVRWSVDSLVAAGVIIPGHAYRIQFMVHDGDQNKNGGDTGQNCAIVSIGAPSPCGATILVTPPTAWYPMTPASGPPTSMDLE